MTRPTTRDRLDGAPMFVMVGGGEMQLQRGLSWLARVMLLELLAIADHVTGHIRTSYSALAIVCAVDGPARGPQPDQTTVQRLRTALAELRANGLVKFSPIKNEKQQGLFLRVPSRVGISASTPKLNTKLNRVPSLAKEHKPLSRSEVVHKTQQGTQQVSQETGYYYSEEFLQHLTAHLARQTASASGASTSRVHNSGDNVPLPVHVAAALAKSTARIAAKRAGKDA